MSITTTWRAKAQASANNYVILEDNRWVAAIQFNGEFMEAKQQELVSVLAAAPDLLAALIAISNQTTDLAAQDIACKAIAQARSAS